NTEIWIYNNLFANLPIANPAINVAAGGSNLYIINNTIVGGSGTGSYGISINTWLNKYGINNLILFNAGAGIFQGTSCGTANSLILENNMLYGNGAGGTTDFQSSSGFGSWGFVASNYTTTGLSGTTCVYGGCNTTHVRTDFVVSSSDSHLAASSPAIDKGAPSS